MSAFICSDLHIATIATGLHTLFGVDALKFANEAKRENIKSVNYRYGEKTRFSAVKTTGQESWGTSGDLLALMHCLDYQSCEHPGWSGCYAQTVLQLCASLLEKEGTQATPGVWSGCYAQTIRQLCTRLLEKEGTQATPGVWSL